MTTGGLITPEVWGPHGWKFIHYVTLNYPDKPTNDDKQRYKAFLLLLKYVLPCNLCSENYAKHLQELPLTDDVLSSKENLIRWGIDMHNTVNEMKNKPIMKYIDARRFIDTNVQCKRPIKTVERFVDELPQFSSSKPETESVKTENKKVETNKKESCGVLNLSTVHMALILLGILVLIAFISKRK